MLQSVHPGDLINPGAKESSPGHIENKEEELKLDTTAFSILSHLSYLFVLINIMSWSLLADLE
jgi:hypothetical protein